jgi:hypothetical protein
LPDQWRGGCAHIMRCLVDKLRLISHHSPILHNDLLYRRTMKPVLSHSPSNTHWPNPIPAPNITKRSATANI